MTMTMRGDVLRCDTCAVWQRVELFLGGCWSSERLDGDLSKGPAGFTYPYDGCEAWLSTDPIWDLTLPPRAYGERTDGGKDG